ncbi:MAG: hypothetical protein H0U74_11285 [Bradymonadaceae bacterium]|nr:hypothetical protein [Lujinxingiaceae bacterium]
MLLALGLLAALAFTGCRPSTQGCHGASDCFQGERCVDGQCLAGIVPVDDVGSDSSDTGSDSSDTGATERGGTLDQAFGTQGMIDHPIAGHVVLASSVAAQLDGRIILAGSANSRPEKYEFMLMGLMADGSLDRGFGENGVVQLAIDEAAIVRDVALDARGRIVVAGLSKQGSLAETFTLARYLKNGRIDSSFGTDGVLHLRMGAVRTRATKLLIDSQNRIVLGGQFHDPESFEPYSFLIMRLLAESGEVDTSFGEQGRSVVTIGDAGDRMLAMAFDVQGRILTAGYSANGRQGDKIAVARLLSDGKPDESFGTAGKLQIELDGKAAHATAIVALSGGDIIVGGIQYRDVAQTTAASSLLLMRLNNRGERVEEFGAMGKVVTTLSAGADTVRAVLYDARGYLWVVGDSHDESIYNLVLARYTMFGELDTSFGTNGVAYARTDGQVTTSSAIFYDADRLLVAGTLGTDFGWYAFSARWWLR